LKFIASSHVLIIFVLWIFVKSRLYAMVQNKLFEPVWKLKLEKKSTLSGSQRKDDLGIL